MTTQIGATMRLSIKLIALGITTLLLPSIFAPRAQAHYVYFHPIVHVQQTFTQDFVPVKVFAKALFLHSPKEFSCLDQLIDLESHWSATALNSSSGAYGIFQFMPETWGNYNLVKTSDPYKQVHYGLHYIAKRYGSECRALAWHKIKGWY